MRNQKIIRSKDRFPTTHYFVYNNKEYPIKISFFILSSEYFKENQEEIKNSKEIQLVDENSGDNIDLSESSIKEFIKYVEQEEIALNQENVVSLHYLGVKYGVKSLIDDIKEYIDEHQSEFALENLLIHQNDQMCDTDIYEKIISNNFDNYIKTDNIFKVNFPILFRISNNAKIKDQDERLSFYFKCLDKYGKIASILFRNVDFNKYGQKYLSLLITKYSEIFDFQFIDSKVIKKLYEENERLKQTVKDKDEKIEKKEQIINQKKQENEKLKSDNEIQINKQKLLFESKISELNKDVRKFQSEFERVTKENQELKIKNEKEMEILKNEIKSLKGIETKNKQLAESCKILTFTQTQNQGKDGIIQYLDGIANNTNDSHLINIYRTICYRFENYNKLNEADGNPPKFKYTKTDGSLWILFDFKNYQIEISSYSIQSSRYNKDCTHIKSWSIEISNDLNSWETIDEHSNYSGLNGPSIIKAFNVKSNHFARYCLLKSSDDFYGTVDGWALEIDHVEFYGRLKT